MDPDDSTHLHRTLHHSARQSSFIAFSSSCPSLNTSTKSFGWTLNCSGTWKGSFTAAMMVKGGTKEKASYDHRQQLV